MTDRVITEYSEIPDMYFPFAKVPMYRGEINFKMLVKKPVDPSKIPDSIYIQTKGTNGNKLGEWEKVNINLKSDIDNKIGRLPPIADPVINKRNRLLKIRTADFHYLEEDNINILYDDLFSAPLPNPNPVIQEITFEVENAIQGNVQANIPEIITSVLSKERVEKIFTTIKFSEISPSQKFIQYQKKMIEESKVILDLELKDKKSTELANLDSLIRKMNSYGIDINKEQTTHTRKRLGEGTISEILDSIKNSIRQQVIITARFNVIHEEENYWLTFEHPINKLIDQDIMIWIPIPKTSIRNAWKTVYQHSHGKTIRSNVYGTVYRSEKQDDGYWEVAINPIAIFA